MQFALQKFSSRTWDPLTTNLTWFPDVTHIETEASSQRGTETRLWRDLADAMDRRRVLNLNVCGLDSRKLLFVVPATRVETTLVNKVPTNVVVWRCCGFGCCYCCSLGDWGMFGS